MVTETIILSFAAGVVAMCFVGALVCWAGEKWDQRQSERETHLAEIERLHQ